MIKDKVLYGMTILAALRVLTFDMTNYTLLQFLSCMVSVFWLICFALANGSRRCARGDS